MLLCACRSAFLPTQGSHSNEAEQIPRQAFALGLAPTTKSESYHSLTSRVPDGESLLCASSLRGICVPCPCSEPCFRISCRLHQRHCNHAGSAAATEIVHGLVCPMRWARSRDVAMEFLSRPGYRVRHVWHSTSPDATQKHALVRLDPAIDTCGVEAPQRGHSHISWSSRMASTSRNSVNSIPTCWCSAGNEGMKSGLTSWMA